MVSRWSRWTYRGTPDALPAGPQTVLDLLVNAALPAIFAVLIVAFRIYDRLIGRHRAGRSPVEFRWPPE